MSFSTIVGMFCVTVMMCLAAAADAQSPKASTAPPTGATASAVPPDQKWLDLANTVLSDLQTGNYASVEGMSTQQMQQALPADKLKDVWDGVQTQAGHYVSIDGLSCSENGAYHTVVANARFARMNLDISLSFDTSQQLAGLFFSPPATPLPDMQLPAGLTERAVTVGASGDWPLPGTLTLPAGNGPFPAVVLVHGSGPEDRDETISGNKPFRDLAWGLAQRGIAVLRYEKRTMQYRSQCAASVNFTVDDEVVDDAVLAAELLRTEGKVDSKRVFVLGHSLGGMLIPRIAKRTAFAAGYIVMAGPTEPLEDLVLHQVKIRLAGDNSSEAKTTIATLAAQVSEVKGRDLTASTPLYKLPFGGMGAGAPYWLSIRDLHAADEARSISKPILIVQGGLDGQVDEGDLAVWQKTLATKRNVTYRLYPLLSHLFIAGQPTVADYASHPGHVGTTVIDDIANWVHHGGAKNPQ